MKRRAKRDKWAVPTYEEGLVIDLAYLSGIYGWDVDAKRDVWAQCCESRELCDWFIRLAGAHQAGYVNDESTHWERLADWEKRMGRCA